MHLETIRVNDGVKDLVINRARFMEGDQSGTARLFESGAGGAPSPGGLVVNSYFGELCAKYTGGEDIDGDKRTGTCNAGPDELVP